MYTFWDFFFFTMVLPFFHKSLSSHVGLRCSFQGDFDSWPISINNKVLIERELFSRIKAKMCRCDDICWNHLHDIEIFWGFFYFPYDSCHPHTLLATILLLFSQGWLSVILWHGKGHIQRSETNNTGWSMPAVEKSPLVYSCWSSLLEFEIALVTFQNKDCFNILIAWVECNVKKLVIIMSFHSLHFVKPIKYILFYFLGLCTFAFSSIHVTLH